MKVAGLHDRIFHIGGAEAVFFDLIKKEAGGDSDITIFTLFCDRNKIEIDGVIYPIITALPTRLNNIFVRGSTSDSVLSSILDYRNLMPFYPQLCRILRKKIEKYAPDRTIISSFAAVKNIVSPVSSYDKQTDIPPVKGDAGKAGGFANNIKEDVRIGKFTNNHTTLYLHSPNQYIRENYDEYSKKLTGLKGRVFKNITPYLRRRDAQARHYDQIMCNSQYTKSIAVDLYPPVKGDGEVGARGFFEAKVQYPTIDTRFTSTTPPTTKKNYFVFVGRLTTFVREVDKIIELFNTTGEQLIIMGSGPDEAYLQSIAGPTITFVGRITDVQEKIDIMKYARGFVNIAKESCGIATMEALALGLPVFGYNDGGTAELVSANQGVLVDKKDSESLEKGFENFMRKFG